MNNPNYIQSTIKIYCINNKVTVSNDKSITKLLLQFSVRKIHNYTVWPVSLGIFLEAQDSNNNLNISYSELCYNIPP